MTPVSQIAVTKASMRRLLAASGTFQTLVGAATAEEAELRIHYGLASDVIDPDDDQELIDPRPRAIIWNDVGGTVFNREGGSNWEGEYTLYLMIEAPLPDEYASNYSDENIWWDNIYGDIIADLQTNSGGDTGGATPLPYMNVNGIEVGASGRNEPKEDPQQKLCYGVSLAIRGR